MTPTAPQYTPEAIVSMVDRMEDDRSLLHARMDADMDAYHLTPYAGELDANGEDTLADYKKFTSNDPQTVMNLAMHLGSTAKRIVRVHQPRAQKPQREINNVKELFCLGALVAADERRQRLGAPQLQDAMFSQSLLRGRVCQRVLLVKEPVAAQNLGPSDGEPVGMPQTRTYIDITDWDPRNTYYAMGKHGLAWVCEKSYKSRHEIMTEWGIDPAEDASKPVGGDDHSQDYAVYDWLDEQVNQVLLEGDRYLKPPTPHGMGRTPVAFALAELRPRFQMADQPTGGSTRNTPDYEVYYGESLYRADRAVFKEQNFLYSVLAELAKRSIKPALNIMSRDGSLTLKGDPRVSGQETSLSTANEEAILPMPPIEVVKEYGSFLGMVSSMMQRGTFPSTAFGEIAFQLSSIAIDRLRSGMQAPMTPHIKAVISAYKQTLDILCDAYATGNFDPMQLYGRRQDPGRTYFAQVIPPELMREGGIIEMDMIPQLPQDDAARVSLAQMLREANPTPLADDRFLREYLDFQDPDQMERAVWEQMANRGSPMAIAWNSYQAASQQGDEDLAAIWWDEFMREGMMKWLETMQLMMLTGGQGAGMPGEGGENGGGGSAPAAKAALPRSSAVPPQAMGRGGAPNPAAATAGGQMGAGQPRPGARQPTFGPGAMPPWAR
jgi:hypothetical protein